MKKIAQQRNLTGYVVKAVTFDIGEILAGYDKSLKWYKLYCQEFKK